MVFPECLLVLLFMMFTVKKPYSIVGCCLFLQVLSVFTKCPMLPFYSHIKSHLPTVSYMSLTTPVAPRYTFFFFYLRHLHVFLFYPLQVLMWRRKTKNWTIFYLCFNIGRISGGVTIWSMIKPFFELKVTPLMARTTMCKHEHLVCFNPCWKKTGSQKINYFTKT